MPFGKEFAEYQRWRKIGMNLHSKIIKKIPKDVIGQAGMDLRIVSKSGIFIFDSVDETLFLMDRAIYDVRINGRRFIDIYIDELSINDSLNDEERKFLQAMRNSYYSLFIITGIKRGKGLTLKDAFSSAELFLMDLNLSLSVSLDFIISTRILSIDNLNFTGGCACMFESNHLDTLRNNFIRLFEQKSAQMSWDEMMSRYSYYFFRKMKEFGIIFETRDVTE